MYNDPEVTEMTIISSKRNPTLDRKTRDKFQEDILKYQNCTYFGDYPLIGVILDDIFILMESQNITHFTLPAMATKPYKDIVFNFTKNDENVYKYLNCEVRE